MHTRVRAPHFPSYLSNKNFVRRGARRRPNARKSDFVEDVVKKAQRENLFLSKELGLANPWPKPRHVEMSGALRSLQTPLGPMLNWEQRVSNAYG